MSGTRLVMESRKVIVPGVGAMVRTRTLTLEGEEVDLEYRWPRRGDGAWDLRRSSRPGPKSSAIAASVL